MKKISIAIMVLILGFNITYALEEGLSVNKLPSGQKVVIKEVKDNPIVKIDTWINTGSINENDKNNGISHFLEHLFFKGTKKYPTGAMDKILDSKGATVNAATSKDYTHYYIQIPSKDFELALNLHADMLQNPLIPRKELERERPVVIEEISKTKDSPQNRMFDNLYTALYSKSNHPYKRTIIGKKEVIETITREEILDYFNKFYTPDAYTTIIVGDVDSADALKKVEAAFSQRQKMKQVKIKYPKVKPLDKIERVDEAMDINKTHMLIGFLAPKFSDNIDMYALDVLSTILASGKSSILNSELKENKQLVLSISAGNYSQKDSGIFYIYSTMEPDKKELVEKEIISELKKILNGNFDENIITKAKNMIKTDTYYSRESISNISDDLGYDFTFIQDENFYENYLKNIDKITKADIVNAAKKYILLDKYVISTVHPNGFKKVSNIENKKEDNYVKVLETKNNTKKVQFPNGATLITKNKKTNSIIALDISIKGSKAVEKKPLSAMLSALCAKCGTQNYTNSQLAQFLDENGIKLALTVTNDVYSIVLQTTKDNLDKAFIALDEVMNKPLFIDSEIEKIKQRTIQETKGISDNPSSYVFDEFKKLAFPNTIYGQNSTFILNNINKVTRGDIIEYYSNIFNPENMTISVVGDIDENYLINKLNSIIKKPKNAKKFSYTDYKYTPFRPSNNVQTTLYKDEVQANWMTLGYKICSVQNRKEIATLNVINAILGEGMSSRLFRKLREEQGLAYTVGSTISTNMKDGAFITYIGTNEKSIDKAKQEILNQIEILKTEMVTTQELTDAKNKILGQLLMSLETNMEEADMLGWYNILGKNLNGFDEYKEMIMNVSQSDVIEIANKYFSKPYIYTVVKAKKILNH